MSAARCEVSWNPGSYPYTRRCKEPAAMRVRLFEPDDTTEDIDLCEGHAKIAGQDYPDNIKVLMTYGY